MGWTGHDSDVPLNYNHGISWLREKGCLDTELGQNYTILYLGTVIIILCILPAKMNNSG